MTDQSITNKVGRPSKYKEEYCEEFLRLSELGLTAVSIAEEFDVHTDTLQEWIKVHPKFSVAYSRGAQKRSSYYLKLAQANMSNKDFNFNMFRWMSKFVCEKKHVGATVYVPGMSGTNDPLEKIKLTLKALSEEIITPDEAKVIVGTLDQAAKCIASVSDFNDVMNDFKEQLLLLKSNKGD
tara:strand:+ start:7274 stop:7816 length:543 start_codon:yes stop_codon:yes gene_type:complete